MVDHNLFTRYIPSELSNLKYIVSLDFSENGLSGEIPPTIGNCLSLEDLNFSINHLSGSIPSSLGFLKGLQVLDLSRYNFSGIIPKILGELSNLQSLNVSCNILEGVVPIEGIFQNASAFPISRNKVICGGITELGLPKCQGLMSTMEKMGITWKVVLGALIPSVLVALTIVICWRKKHAPKSPYEQWPENLMRISYNDLYRATGGFSLINLIGSGRYGSLFKGTLRQDEPHVAVKVLNLLEHGALKSFIAECEALKAIRHRNLIKIITVCSSVDFKGSYFKALVFEFMPNGSLEDWLHPVSDERYVVKSLDISQRLNIAIDVASALDYLHNECSTPIIHCDLKPSNMLLHDDFTACVGDFGLAKYYSTTMSDHSATTAVRGTIGYIPPEYGMGGEVCPEGDVYNYGTLLLEIFTGKRPTDQIFKDGLSLHDFSKTALAERVMDVIDTRLLSKNSINEETKELFSSVIKVGIMCSLEQKSERMSIKDVLKELLLIKEITFANEVEKHSKQEDLLMS